MMKSKPISMWFCAACAALGLLASALVCLGFTGIFEESAVKVVTLPQSKNNGDATSTYVDTAGYKSVTFLLLTGATDCTIDMHIHEGATTSPTTNITGAAITQLSGTDDGKCAAIQIDLTGARLRYMAPVVTLSNVTAGLVSCVAILSHGQVSPPPLSDASGYLKELIRK